MHDAVTIGAQGNSYYPELLFQAGAPIGDRKSGRGVAMPEVDSSLIYVSRKRIAAAANEAAIAEIVAASQARNAKLGVTGALISTSEHFAQVLEGPLHAIEELMDSIHVDMRHSDVSVLRIAPIARRSFAGWSMAYSGGSDYVARQIAPLLGAEVEENDTRIDRLIGFMAGLVK
jgi:hypothetical protein